MSLAPELLAILVCPQCKGKLEHRTASNAGGTKESLVCHTCRLVYAVDDDIPVMLIDDATPLGNDNPGVSA